MILYIFFLDTNERWWSIYWLHQYVDIEVCTRSCIFLLYTYKRWWSIFWLHRYVDIYSLVYQFTICLWTWDSDHIHGLKGTWVLSYLKNCQHRLYPSYLSCNTSLQCLHWSLQSPIWYNCFMQNVLIRAFWDLSLILFQMNPSLTLIQIFVLSSSR